MAILNKHTEYTRLKRMLHSQDTYDEVVKNEIENYCATYADDKKRCLNLKLKYWWYRRVLKIQVGLLPYPDDWQDKPFISVIVPNYNHSLYLKERIDCILNQTYQNFELILMDDCSKDNSAKILNSYKDHPRVSHIILNEENTGNTFKQWIKGVSLAKGDYVWIAESDDYADESYLESVARILYLHPDAVMVRSGSYMVNEHDRVLMQNPDYFIEDGSLHVFDGLYYTRNAMLYSNTVYNASMVTFRKDAFIEIDKSFMELRYTGDWQCWVEIMQKGKVCEYRRKLNYFRQHTNKVTYNASLNYAGAKNPISVLRYIHNNVPLSSYRKMIVRGELYRKIKHVEDCDAVGSADFIRKSRQNPKISYLDYIIFRIHRNIAGVLPFLMSYKNDLKRLG